MHILTINTMLPKLTSFILPLIHSGEGALLNNLYFWFSLRLLPYSQQGDVESNYFGENVRKLSQNMKSYHSSIHLAFARLETRCEIVNCLETKLQPHILCSTVSNRGQKFRTRCILPNHPQILIVNYLCFTVLFYLSVQQG